MIAKRQNKRRLTKEEKAENNLVNIVTWAIILLITAVIWLVILGLLLWGTVALLELISVKGVK